MGQLKPVCCSREGQRLPMRVFTGVRWGSGCYLGLAGAGDGREPASGLESSWSAPCPSRAGSFHCQHDLRKRTSIGTAPCQAGLASAFFLNKRDHIFWWPRVGPRRPGRAQLCAWVGHAPPWWNLELFSEYQFSPPQSPTCCVSWSVHQSW